MCMVQAQLGITVQYKQMLVRGTTANQRKRREGEGRGSVGQVRAVGQKEERRGQGTGDLSFMFWQGVRLKDCSGQGVSRMGKRKGNGKGNGKGKMSYLSRIGDSEEQANEPASVPARPSS
jgi:hypothetical protein